MRIRAAKSKYYAQPTIVDGIRFASKKEARRYQELRLLEKAGEIHGLKLQHRIVLSVPAIEEPHTPKKIGEYIADFSYCTCFYGRDGVGCLRDRGVIEDVKGFKTPLYRWKKKHVKAQYGIEIREV